MIKCIVSPSGTSMIQVDFNQFNSPRPDTCTNFQIDLKKASGEERAKLKKEIKAYMKINYTIVVRSDLEYINIFHFISSSSSSSYTNLHSHRTYNEK
ncbi:hypothetical protein DFA_05192 [Cavenderia fasciculata]|uniref:Uncharacterized protein n=1 Tax=Cavenderia fasciculata TaxID=261658 RepID=F4PNK9_CACFS|nr:uncharacterized protein DFA_05192 [Cavenderia fasciculata]EGG23062.1 hypothetical protein DFA_05192 [Cavenderia fasciculata]|eukprot:XP_004360913.1 hypothetical protein DFA_05192 [Cavenderia fasciculata]